MKPRRRMFRLCFLGSILIACACFAQQQHEPLPDQQESLRKFLRDAGNDQETRYFSAFVDLRDDGVREAIVYFTNRCGSGGCTTWILEPTGSSYRVVTRITIARPPIRLLNTKTNGWHDISVIVAGGGIMAAYEAKLSFDGKKYPGNPSIAPAQQLTQNVPGKIIVPVGITGSPLN
jgi:hypothetical protein